MRSLRIFRKMKKLTLGGKKKKKKKKGVSDGLHVAMNIKVTLDLVNRQILVRGNQGQSAVRGSSRESPLSPRPPQLSLEKILKDPLV